MPETTFPAPFRLMLLATRMGLPGAGAVDTDGEMQELTQACRAVEDWQEFVAVTFRHRLVPRVLPVLRKATLELRLVPGLRSAGQIVRRYLTRPRVWSYFDPPDRLLWLSPVLGALMPPRLVETHRAPRATPGNKR